MIIEWLSNRCCIFTSNLALLTWHVVIENNDLCLVSSSWYFTLNYYQLVLVTMWFLVKRSLRITVQKLLGLKLTYTYFQSKCYWIWSELCSFTIDCNVFCFSCAMNGILTKTESLYELQFEMNVAPDACVEAWSYHGGYVEPPYSTSIEPVIF